MGRAMYINHQQPRLPTPARSNTGVLVMTAIVKTLAFAVPSTITNTITLCYAFCSGSMSLSS